ncbi:MAG TPA: hypothetical protein VNW97_14285 [Candidatus Saccharimonadales bacterium]|nr:hypothetical protein [Candidatus Saccharimonadales bacterium]
MFKRLILSGAALLLASAMFAQVTIAAPQSEGKKFISFTGDKRTMSYDELPGPDANLFFMEMSGSDELVIGAPYAATAVTETVQTLGDGNRIVHKNITSLARDGQGRTRREESFSNVGPLSVEGPKTIIIRDPVKETTFILHPDRGTARTLKIRQARILSLHGPGAEGDAVRDGIFSSNVVILGNKIAKAEAEATAGSIARHTVSLHGREEVGGEVKHESLGTQTIEGVSCEGKRETRTIPAGAIGNDRPIEIVSETWTSPELHALVLRKRNDPRSGVTTYRLTNIKRGEPDASLFQAPEGPKSIGTEKPGKD